MHLAYVCSDLGVPVGGTKGASVHLRALSQELALRGHRVSLLAANSSGSLPDGFLPELSAIGYDRTLKRIKKRMHDLDPSSTAARETYALLLGNLAWDRLSLLHAEQPLDGVYERHSLWSWAALRFAREHGIPHLVEFNAPLVEEQRRFRRLAMNELAESCERELVSGATGIVVPSTELAAHAERLGARQGRIHVLPNAVDHRAFLAPPDLDAERIRHLEDSFIIAFVGSLKPWHGIDSLLSTLPRVVEAVPDAHLLVVGDGPESPAVQRVARELGPGRVTSTGAVPHEEIPAWLRLADVGVAPYPQMDDFYFSPMKIVEYQAAGLAVVASDIGHIRNQVESGVTGLLIPPGDDDALARTVIELAGDRDAVERLGRLARARVMRHSTWKAVAARVELLFDRAAPGRFERLAAGAR